jgi:hypothetical protein
MESSSDLQPADILGILDDLWRRVAADSSR